MGPFDTILSRKDVFQPDILFVSAQRAHIVTARNVQGPPDLVVEVASPYSARKDRVLREARYVARRAAL